MKRTVHTDDNVFDYFNDRVGTARSELGRDLTDETALYLASMLSERVRADRPEPEEQTLAELHGRASLAPMHTQLRTYRELGDRALYLLGFFQESLRRTTVGPGYYADMGSAAYHRVDQLFKRWFADCFGPVFTELAARFDDCALVLAKVREAVERDAAEREAQAMVLSRGGDVEERLKQLGFFVPGVEPSDA